MRTDMQDGPPPAGMALSDLCARCREETARYRNAEPHDDRFCFEVFRRAVAERDDHCWQELHEIYHHLVLAWCRTTDPPEDADELVSLTWQKFWRSYTPEKLAGAAGASSVLAYLRTCAHSVAVDLARARPRTVPLDVATFARSDAKPSPAEQMAARAGAAALWQVVEGHLRDQRERTLMYLMFEIDLKPAEVHARHPNLFADVRDVYKCKRNILDRLARSRELAAWLAGEGT